MNSVSPAPYRFRSEHMNTWFEVRIAHPEETYARQAAQAAFALTTRLENLLSRFIEDSEVSQIRHLTPGASLRLSLETFTLLQIATELHQATGGAFDPGLAIPMEATRGHLHFPVPAIGTRGRLILEPDTLSARTEGGLVALDLGAIGKGYALDRMAEILKEWDITHALLIAGESSILALAGPHLSGSSSWEISLTSTQKLLLHHQAISSSGTSVKGAHILDPRTGQPPDQAPFRTWALAPTAAVSDALSTAWMLLDHDEINLVCKKIVGVSAILQISSDEPTPLHNLGLPLDLEPSRPRPSIF